MSRKFTKNFGEFVNESTQSEFRGLPLSEFMPLFTKLVELCPNLEEVSYPGDEVGHQSHVITLKRNGKIDEPYMSTKDGGLEQMQNDLVDIEKAYQNKEGNDIPTFYVWTIYTRGLKYNELSDKLKAIGGLPSPQDIKLPELNQLLMVKPEIAEAIVHIQVTLDSANRHDFAKAMNSGEFGPLD